MVSELGNIVHHTTPCGIQAIAEDIGKLENSLVCSRERVYPRAPSDTLTLNTGAGADDWGAWTELVPSNTVSFQFGVRGVYAEAISATGTYHIQIGSCAAGMTPATCQIQGETRFTATAPVARSSGLLPIDTQHIDPDQRVMGRVRNDSGGDNISISLVIRRHSEVSEELAPVSGFPW